MKCNFNYQLKKTVIYVTVNSQWIANLVSLANSVLRI